jgi:hypothetical protein
MNARLANSLLLQGGVSTENTMTDNCAIVNQVPEALFVAPAFATGVWQPKSFCCQETGYRPQYKAFASSSRSTSDGIFEGVR